MTAATLPIVEPELGDIDDDVAHEMCCDDDIALCGEYLPGDDWLDEDDDSPLCPMCAYVAENRLSCPVKGCPRGSRGLRRLYYRMRGWV